MTLYTTYGSVRGGCGHKHRSIQAAQHCAYRDQHACNEYRCYSDRRVLPVDSEELPASYREKLAGRHRVEPAVRKKSKGKSVQNKPQFPIPSSQGEAFTRLYEIADELGPILKSQNRYNFNYPRFKRLGEEVFHIISCFCEEGLRD